MCGNYKWYFPMRKTNGATSSDSGYLGGNRWELLDG